MGLRHNGKKGNKFRLHRVGLLAGTVSCGSVMHTSFLRGRGDGHKNDRSDVTGGTGSSGSPSLGALLHCGTGT